MKNITKTRFRQAICRFMPHLFSGLILILFTAVSLGMWLPVSEHVPGISGLGAAEALAQGGGSAPPGGGSSVNPGTGKLENLLKFNDLTGFLLAVIEVILIFALPIIVFFIIYAGFLFVTARGDTSQIETAKSALMWAVVGGTIVLGARLIVTVICGTVNQFGSFSVTCLP